MVNDWSKSRYRVIGEVNKGSLHSGSSLCVPVSVCQVRVRLGLGLESKN